MNLSAISLSLTRPGRTALSLEQLVAGLFSAGEQGAWYDPSDTTTLFQAYTGGAVTDVEQPVGIMLDKRKGLALEAALNVDFTSGWSGVAGGTVTDSNTFTCASVGGITKSMLTIGKAYKLTVSYVKTGLSTQFTINNHDGSTLNTIYTATAASGSATITFYATNASLYFRCNAADTIDVTWSIQAIEGNHAYQTTSSARPHLRSRYNLMEYSEQFSNAWWTSPFATVTITDNTVVAPDGTTTADTFGETANTSVFTRRRGTEIVGVASGAAVTASIYAKKGTRKRIALGFYTNNGYVDNVWGVFDLDSGTVVGESTAGNSSIQSVGNGWYRLSVRQTSASVWRYAVQICRDTDTSPPADYLGSADNYLYIWGAQMNLGSTAMSYQRIAAAPTLSQPPTYATTSTMGGEVFRPYIEFDGSDDRLLTAAIDYSATATMTVACGQTKLRNAISAVMELSANSSSNNGTFGLFATRNADDYGIHLRGTSSLEAVTGTYASPATHVLTYLADISAALGSEAVLRVNGSSVSLTAIGVSTDAGTGNFGSAYPMYLGMRGGASLPWQGRLFALIVRATTTSGSNLSNLESYVAGKTGVTL